MTARPDPSARKPARVPRTGDRAAAADAEAFKPRQEPTRSVTYCGIIRDPRCDDVLVPMGWVLSRARHWVFLQVHVLGRTPGKVKPEALRLFGITSRQFDGVRIDVDQAVNAWRGTLEWRISDVADRIEGTEDRLRRLARNYFQAKGDRRRAHVRFTITAKRQRLDALGGELGVLRRELAAGRPRMCFGGRDALRDGDVDAWRERRVNRIFLVGCSRETDGNQTARLRNGKLRVRLPDALGGTHVELEGLEFRFGQAAVERATRERRAVSWLLFRDEWGRWHAHATVDAEAAPAQGPQRGYVAVDLNVDHVAAVAVDRHGNPTLRLTLPFPDHRVPSGRAAAMVGDAVRDVCKWAESLGYGVASETLDLARKKASLRERGAAHARRLSGWAYKRFGDMLAARCLRMRLRHDAVNPA